MAKEQQYFELTGIGYNIMTRKANKWGKFQVDLELIDPEQIKKAEELQAKYGVKIKDVLKYSSGGTLQSKTGVSAVTLTAKEVTEGQYPRKFIPTTKSDTNEVVTDLISHGAEITVRFKIYGYEGGTNAQGFSYPSGYSVQLEGVKLHKYTPYRSAA